MKLIQKASIIRVFNDIIKSNHNINLDEIELYRNLLREYNFDKDDEQRSEKVSLERAVFTLKQMDNSLKNTILEQITKLSTCTGVSTREKMLLLLTLDYCLKDSANVVSIKNTSLKLDSKQILYIESGFDEKINQEISDNFRQISKELRYSGFNFIYLPQYKNSLIEPENAIFEKIFSFLAPNYDLAQIALIKENFSKLTSSKFYQNTLSSKLNINLSEDNSPALILKVNSSIIENDNQDNILIIKINDSITKLIYNFTDKLSSAQISNPLHIEKSSQNQFNYKGFYQLLLENNLSKNTVHSSIIIDTLHQEIIFKDINEKLSGVNRREKALYVLFLLESNNGGIDFNLSENLSDFKDKNSRLKKLQSKYTSIYKIFGGETSKAPDISIAEIRLPMLSRIKKSINKISYKLRNHQDYIIRRQTNGVYNLALDINIVLCKDTKNIKPVAILESEAFRKIKPL